jgi:hypothetical protein
MFGNPSILKKLGLEKGICSVNEAAEFNNKSLMKIAK